MKISRMDSLQAFLTFVQKTYFIRDKNIFHKLSWHQHYHHHHHHHLQPLWILSYWSKNNHRSSRARRHSRDWTMITLSMAIEIALAADKSNSLDPSAFHFFYLIVLFAFAAVLISRFISSKLPLTAKVLDCVGHFFNRLLLCYLYYSSTQPQGHHLDCLLNLLSRHGVFQLLFIVQSLW